MIHHLKGLPASSSYTCGKFGCPKGQRATRGGITGNFSNPFQWFGCGLEEMYKRAKCIIICQAFVDVRALPCRGTSWLALHGCVSGQQKQAQHEQLSDSRLSLNSGSPSFNSGKCRCVCVTKPALFPGQHASNDPWRSWTRWGSMELDATVYVRHCWCVFLRKGAPPQ